MEKEERGWWFRRRSFAFIDSYGGENRGHHFQRTCIYVWKRHDLCVNGVAGKSKNGLQRAYPHAPYDGTHRLLVVVNHFVIL